MGRLKIKAYNREKRKYMNINVMTNYELIQQKELKDLKSEGYLLRHKKSGARVLLMENDDENKVFTIACILGEAFQESSVFFR